MQRIMNFKILIYILVQLLVLEMRDSLMTSQEEENNSTLSSLEYYNGEINLSFLICTEYNYTSATNHLMSNFPWIVHRNVLIQEFSVAVQNFEKCQDLMDTFVNVTDGNEVSVQKFVLIFNTVDQIISTILKVAEMEYSWRNFRLKHVVWLPHLIIIWPQQNFTAIVPFKEILARELSLSTQPYLISLDSQIYIVTPTPTTQSLPGINGSTYENGEFSHSFNDSNNFILWEIYHANSKLIIEPVQTQNDGLVMDQLFSLTTIAKRRKFHKLPVKVAGVTQTSNTFDLDIDRVNETAVIFLGGYSVQLMWCLRDSLDFTEVGFYADAYTGIDPLTNDINGIGKNVVNGEIDLGIALHTLLEYRFKHFAYLQPAHTERNHAYFLQPSSSSTRDLVILPFSYELWVGIGVIWIIIIICYKILDTVLIRQTFQAKEATLDLSDIVYWQGSVLCQQGWPSDPSFLSKRIVLLISFTLSLMIYVSYSAGVTSALAVYVAPVKTWTDLVNYGYSVIATVSIKKFYMAIPAKAESFKLIADTEKYYINQSDTIARALQRNSHVVSVMSIDGFYFEASKMGHTNEELCKMSQMRLGAPQEVIAMIVQKGSQFREYFNTKTIQLIERGLRHHHMTIYHRNANPACPPLDKTAVTFQQLKFRDAALIFKIMTAGVILAIGMMAGEFMYIYRVTSNKRRQEQLLLWTVD